MSKILDYLRNRSQPAKNRIVYASVLVAMMSLGFIWINNISTRLTSLSSGDIIPEQGAVMSAVNHVTVESAEDRDGKKYIYFKVENSTSDILNFPGVDRITLEVKDKGLAPEKILDRRQQPFVVKVLSNTTNHGIMVFPSPDSQDAELNIKDMFFEQTPTNTFRQTIEIDFNELKTLEELRS